MKNFFGWLFSKSKDEEISEKTALLELEIEHVRTELESLFLAIEHIAKILKGFEPGWPEAISKKVLDTEKDLIEVTEQLKEQTETLNILLNNILQENSTVWKKKPSLKDKD